MGLADSSIHTFYVWGFWKDAHNAHNAFHKLPLNNNRNNSYESSFFPLSYGMSHLMPSTDKATLIVRNEPVSLAVLILIEHPKPI
jgi:hypothetical protein